MPTVNRAIKYRIHPSEEQMTQLLQTFGCVRKVFNAAIELQEGLYAAKMGSMSKMDLNNHSHIGVLPLIYADALYPILDRRNSFV